MNHTKSKQKQTDPTSMRLPEALKDCLAEAASAAGRSLNAEIRLRLEWSLERFPKLSGAADLEGALERRLCALEAWVTVQDPKFAKAIEDDDKSAAEILITRANKNLQLSGQ